MIPFSGFKGTSLIDFPNKVSSIIFIAGCNLRCPYCHNGRLFEIDDSQIISEKIILEKLQQRIKFIDGIVFTGGEPSLYSELVDFIKKIKSEFNILIKLDSNGLNPDFIKKTLDFVDFFAIDIKTTPDLYCKELGASLSESEIKQKLQETKQILEKCENKEIEYRTTMYPPVVESYERLYKMMEFIPRNANHYLQRFIAETSWSEIAQKTKSFSEKQIENMVKELRKNTNNQNIFMRTYL